MRLLDPSQCFIIVEFLFKISQGIKVLPVKVIFLFLVWIKSVADFYLRVGKKRKHKGW